MFLFVFLLFAMRLFALIWAIFGVFFTDFTVNSMVKVLDYVAECPLFDFNFQLLENHDWFLHSHYRRHCVFFSRFLTVNFSIKTIPGKKIFQMLFLSVLILQKISFFSDAANKMSIIINFLKLKNILIYWMQIKNF